MLFGTIKNYDETKGVGMIKPENGHVDLQFEKSADGGKCTPGCHKERAYNRSKPTTRPTPPSPGGVS